MKIHGIITSTVIVLSLNRCLWAVPQINPPPVSAAELVRAVRESENWLHHIDSLQLDVSGKWTRTPQGLAKRRAEIKLNNPDASLDPNLHSDLLPVGFDTLEIAFDQYRLSYKYLDPTYWLQHKIWDGHELKFHEKYFNKDQEAYVLDAEIQGHAQEMLSVSTAWPRAQTHSFWWDTKDPEDLMEIYGRSEDFKITGESNYRGTDCFILECNLSDIPSLSYRWYVGKKDRLLYGNIKLRNDQTTTEFWCSDYQQVAENCWMPMTQGYHSYEKDFNNNLYIPAYRNIKITKVKLNEKLPDELFQMEFTEGVEVQDKRSGELRRYIYQKPPPSLIGNPLPPFDNINFDFNLDQTIGSALLLCFGDILQRPTRHYLTELTQKNQQLAPKNVTVIAVQTAPIDPNELKNWTTQNNITFPVGMLEGDEEKVKFDWGVQALPWLVLTDPNHVVRAEGFSLDELDKKIKEILLHYCSDSLYPLPGKVLGQRRCGSVSIRYRRAWTKRYFILAEEAKILKIT